MKPSLEFDGKVEFTLTNLVPKVNGSITIEGKEYPFIASGCKVTADNKTVELSGLYFEEPCLDSRCKLKLLGPFALKYDTVEMISG